MDDLTYEALKKSVEFTIGAGSFMLALQFLCLAYLANNCNAF